MRYFGKKSLSSLLSGIFHVSWYVVLVLSIVTAVIGTILLFSIPLGDTLASIVANCNMDISGMDKKDYNCWRMIKNLPFALKILILPYFGAIVVLLLKMINKLRHLFTNFKNDIVFNKSNVFIISSISKLNIACSILTFNLSSLLVSVFLFMLCEIFKNGTALQEEHDLTV